MKRISFDTSEKAATPQHDCGEFHMTVADEEVASKVEALITLGFTPTITEATT